MTKRAVVVSRVSTEEQVKGTSIDAQIEKCRKYADLSDWEVVAEIRDEGVSGSKALAERPGGQRVLEMAQRGEVDVVIFTKIDRFARTVRKALEDFDTLQDLGVEVAFVEEKIDTTTPQGRMFRSLLLVFAEFEREQISSRNLSGRVARADESRDPETGRITRWVGGHVPFGYAIAEDKTLILDKKDAAAVALCFKLRAEGKSTVEIAGYLDSKGYQSRERKRQADSFGPKLVGDILKRPVYKGDGHPRVVDHTTGVVEVFDFPAIVDPKVWEKAQTAYKGRKRKGRVESRQYPLSERIVHQCCGESVLMFGQARRIGKTRSGEYRRWYRCNNAEKARGTGECEGFGIHRNRTMTAVQADIVEAGVLRWILTQRAEDWQRIVEEDIARYEEQFGTFDFAGAEERLAAIDARLERIEAAYDGGEYDLAKMRTKKAPLEIEREAIEDDIKRAEARGEGVQLRGVTIDALLSMDIAETGDPSEPDAIPSAAERREELLRQCAATLGEPDRFGRTPRLSPEALETLTDLVGRLGIEVTVEANPEDVRRPRMSLTFEGGAVVSPDSATAVSFASG